jgi:hypothetical protein
MPGRNTSIDPVVGKVLTSNSPCDYCLYKLIVKLVRVHDVQILACELAIIFITTIQLISNETVIRNGWFLYDRT